MIEMIEDDGNGNGNDVRARRWFSYLWIQMVLVFLDLEGFRIFWIQKVFTLILNLDPKDFRIFYVR